VTDDDRKRFSLTRTSWFLDRREMVRTLRSCQVYFAPRRTEGIGMSFLEAMAQGMAVVAADGATMNEYIVSGNNGFLYNPDAPEVPEWDRASLWGARARETAEAGRSRWEASLPALQQFLSAGGPARAAPGPNPEAARRHRKAVVKYGFYLTVEPLRILKRLMIAFVTKEKR
jgi:glycosyltransferase involved in cell wall biosynthesis